MQPDRIEVLRLDNGRISVRHYHLGLLREAVYVAEANLAAQLQAWPGLPVYLHRSAAQLAEPLRAAGRDVRGAEGWWSQVRTRSRYTSSSHSTFSGWHAPRRHQRHQ